MLDSPQAMQYMELLPKSRRPVSGTTGALERRRQLLTQLPVYDQDPMKCQSLSSEEEVPDVVGSASSDPTERRRNLFLCLQISSMILFVKRYKEEVLGVGEVGLPGEGGALKEAATQRRAKEDAAQHQDRDSAAVASSSAVNGSDDKTQHVRRNKNLIFK